MITRLEVDGFKSLREFAIDLGPFTALVGPNSAGKSNILEALALLSHLASEPIEAAFKHGRGRAIDQFTLEKGEPLRAIRFAVELLLPAPVDCGGAATNRLRYELTITRERRASGAEKLVVEHERLATIGEQQDTWTALYPALARRARHAPANELLRSPGRVPGDVRRGDRRLRTSGRGLLVAPESRTALSAIRAALEEYTPGGRAGSTPGLHARTAPERAAAQALAGLRLVHLDSMRLHEESERIGSAALAPDASNLPTVLAALPPHTLGEIRADLAALVPGLSTFDVVADRDTFRIDFELSGGDRLPARLVSEGTLRALALLTALRSEPPPSTIAIEEPENGIYPGRLQTLIDLLREAAAGPVSPLPEGTAARSADEGAGEDDEEDEHPAGPPQVILTSHSPVVLAAMRHDPGCLRFIDVVRRNGHLATRARAVGTPAVGERGTIVPLREVDALLALATTEAAE